MEDKEAFKKYGFNPHAPTKGKKDMRKRFSPLDRLKRFFKHRR